MLTPEHLATEITHGQSQFVVERAAALLEAAGYLDAVAVESTPTFASALGNALRRYQAYRRLPVTGMLDAATLRDLTSAVRYDAAPDIPPNAALRAPDGTTGFVPSGLSWNTRRLRYAFVNNAADLGVEQYQAAIRCALQLWSEVAPLSFVEVPTSASPELRFGFYSGNHGDGTMFDGPGKALGHAPNPGEQNAGDVHFDEAETWTATPQRLGGQPFDLLMVALHEVGHALGLEHSTDPSAVMYAYADNIRRGLSLDDIRGIRYVYRKFGIGATNPAPMPQFSGQTLILGDHRRLDLAQKGVRAEVFYRGADAQLRQVTFAGYNEGKEVWQTTEHGLLIKGLPIVLARGDRENKDGSTLQRYNLFAVGSDGRLRGRYWDGKNWSDVDFGGNFQPGLVVLGRGNFKSLLGAGIRLVVFGVTVDGHLVDTYWDGSQWASHDHGGFVNPGLAVMGFGDHSQLTSGLVRANVFMTRMGDNHLLVRHWNGGEWVWDDHGGSVRGTPAILLHGDQSQVDVANIRASVFVAGTDGHLWERRWNGASWSWIDHPGQAIAGDPIVIGRGNLTSLDRQAIRINVFVRGAGGQLLARTWDGQNWSWFGLGGAISSAPLQWIGHGNFCSVEHDQIRLRILAHGADNHLHEYHWNTTAWEYYDHGAGPGGAGMTSQILSPLFQGASASQEEDAVRLRLFALGGNGKLLHRYWEAAGSAWKPEL